MPEPTETTELSYSTARILRPEQRAVKPSAADLATINDRFALEPLGEEDVFVFDMVASTDATDSYYTYMDPETTLRNYVQDLAQGQALLDSHEIYRLPIGSSYTARQQPITTTEDGDGTTEVLASYFLRRNLTVAGTNTEDYRNGILAGVYRKASIGFGGSDMQWICDVDGLPLWESDYYPGQKLKDGSRVRFKVVNARAMETSLVYKNSTPGALVQRVQQLVNERHMPPSDISFLEQAWHVRFHGAPRLYPGASMTKELTARGMLEGVQQRVGKTISKATRAKLDAAVTRLSDAQGGIDEATAEIASLIEEVDAAAEQDRAVVAALGEDASAERIAVLRQDAQAGKAHRADMIKATVQARVAVMGEGFDVEAYTKRLEKRDFDDLQDEHAAWVGKRAQEFKSGRPLGGADPNARQQPQRVGVVEETIE